MLGHELRNPLAPIVTALQLKRLKGQARGKEDDVIDRQVQHLGRLVDDLLDVSRVTRGKIELQRRPVEIAAAVADALEMASPLYERRGHRIAVDVPGVGLVVDGDPARLSQIFANLLTNAAKYTPAGGQVSVKARQVNGAVEVLVRDDGCGIAPELLPRIFDLFVQGPRPGAEGGLGLGLALVRSLVELHGGNVRAESAGPGQGSTFAVTLPLRQSAAAAAGAPAPPPRAAAAARRVLVVDDNVDAAESLAAFLRESGHEVAVAHDGAQALRAAASRALEVAVLDIGLPVMDGYELAARLRERHPALRLVALTGYGQEGDRQRSADAGFAAHLVKPVDPEAVLAALTG